METLNLADFEKVVSKLMEFVRYCQKLKPNNSYLIVNRNSFTLAKAALKATQDYGLKVKSFDLSADKPYKHFPQKFLRLLREETPKGGMGLFDYSKHPDWGLKETGARIELLSEIEQIPISWAHSPGITLDMAVNGPLQCNYKKMAKEAETILQKLRNVKGLHITAPKGTDVRITIPEAVKFDTDCIIVPPNVYGGPGKFGNLPIGEVWALKRKFVEVLDRETGQKVTQSYPEKLVANGKWICDVCAGGYPHRIDPERPIIVEFREGVVNGFRCDDPGLRTLHDEMLTSQKKYGLPTILEEIGIGLNEKARITGNMLEDEKIRGTCHVAAGNVRFHVDMLVDKPTIDVTYMNGARAEIMKNGVIS